MKMRMKDTSTLLAACRPSCNVIDNMRIKFNLFHLCRTNELEIFFGIKWTYSPYTYAKSMREEKCKTQSKH